MFKKTAVVLLSSLSAVVAYFLWPEMIMEREFGSLRVLEVLRLGGSIVTVAVGVVVSVVIWRG